MPIFEKNGDHVLFIHIPKTGGTSIEHAFRQNGWHIHFFDGGEGASSVNPVLRCSPQHWHADILKNFVRPNAFKAIITTIREPLSRAQSEYSWRKKFFGVQKNVDDWLNDALDRYEIDPFIHDNHVRPQTEFLIEATSAFKIENGTAPVLDFVNAKVSEPLKFDRDYKAMTSNEETSEISAQTDGRHKLHQTTIDRLCAFYRRDIEFWENLT